MTDDTERYYGEALELAGYNALALKAMCLWAYKHRKNRIAMAEAKEAWDPRKPRPYVNAIRYFGADFERGLSTDEILSRIAIAGLPKKKRSALYDELNKYSLTYWQVRERVAELRSKRERKPSLAEQIAAIIGDDRLGYQETYDCIRALPEVKRVLEAKHGKE